MNTQDLLTYNLIKHRDGHKEQNIGQPETRIMKAPENYKQLSRCSTDSFYQSFSSLFANHLKLHSRRYMFLRNRRSFEYRHCRCLARIAIALNRRGGSRIFFRRGCTRLLLYFNTNKPHSFFFSQNNSCIRKPQVISGEGAHPLHPPPRSAPESLLTVRTNPVYKTS